LGILTIKIIPCYGGVGKELFLTTGKCLLKDLAKGSWLKYYDDKKDWGAFFSEICL
jgi:hypothetical protein